MSTNRSSDVRSLRAMFENQESTSPDSRGRSPNGHAPGDRPLSRVRSNFVPVEPSTPPPTDLDLAMEIEIDPAQTKAQHGQRYSTAEYRRESFSLDQSSDSSAIAELKKTISQEHTRRESKPHITETVPESAIEATPDAKTPAVEAKDYMAAGELAANSLKEAEQDEQDDKNDKAAGSGSGSGSNLKAMTLPDENTPADHEDKLPSLPSEAKNAATTSMPIRPKPVTIPSTVLDEDAMPGAEAAKESTPAPESTPAAAPATATVPNSSARRGSIVAPAPASHSARRGSVVAPELPAQNGRPGSRDSIGSGPRPRRASIVNSAEANLPASPAARRQSIIAPELTKPEEEVKPEVVNEPAEAAKHEEEVKPEETAIMPEETKVKPEETEVKPEETEVKPEETEVKPEETEVKPEETVKPEELVKPEETVKQEESETSKPVDVPVAAAAATPSRSQTKTPPPSAKKPTTAPTPSKQSPSIQSSTASPRAPLRKASRSSMAASTTASQTRSKQTSVSAPAGFNAPARNGSKPPTSRASQKSPVSSRLTAPTAASAARQDSHAPSAKPAAAPRPPSTTSTTLKTARPSMSTSKPATRPSTVRPPSGQAKKPESSRPVTKPDESFLARMMRPTASSAIKAHDKVEVKSPPKRTPSLPKKAGAARTKPPAAPKFEKSEKSEKTSRPSTADTENKTNGAAKTEDATADVSTPQATEPAAGETPTNAAMEATPAFNAETIR